VAAGTKLVFRVQAVQRMLGRRIGTEDTRHMIEHGQRVEEYPDATPDQRRLVLGWNAVRFTSSRPTAQHR